MYFKHIACTYINIIIVIIVARYGFNYVTIHFSDTDIVAMCFFYLLKK